MPNQHHPHNVFIDIFQRNVSAIIQPLGKNKEPTISFLELTPNRGSGGGEQLPSSTNLNQSVPIMSRGLHHLTNDLPLLRASSQSLFRSNSTHSSDDNANNIKSSPSPVDLLSSPRLPSDILSQTPPTSRVMSSSNQGGGGGGMDLTRKSPASGRSSTSPGANISPAPSSTPNPIILNNNLSPSGSQMSMGNSGGGPPNYITGTTIGVCPDHLSGRPSGVDCKNCEMILASSRMGALGNLHTRNSCKTLKCPKCNWHYKYQVSSRLSKALYSTVDNLY